MSIGEFSGVHQTGIPSEEERGGIKRKRDEVETHPVKRTKTEPGTLAGKIHDLASMGTKKFSHEASTVAEVTHKLLSKLQSGEYTQEREGVKELKNDLKIIKARVKMHPLLSEGDKQKCLEDIKDILSYMKEGQKFKIKVETSFPSSVIPLIKPDESIVENLYKQGHIKLTEEIKEEVPGQEEVDYESNASGQELIFSQELAAQLDDSMFENILKWLPKDQLDRVSLIDFLKYPLLGAKAPALVLRCCPNIQKSCFSCIEKHPKQFCDHVLQVDDKKISVNKGVLAASSPYFEVLFHSPMRKGQERENVTVINEADFQAVRCCWKSLIGSFEISHNEAQVNFVLSLLEHAHRFQLEDLVLECIQVINSNSFFDNIATDNIDDFFNNLNELAIYKERLLSDKKFSKIYFLSYFEKTPVVLFSQSVHFFLNELNLDEKRDFLSNVVTNIINNIQQYKDRYPNLKIQTSLDEFICLANSCTFNTDIISYLYTMNPSQIFHRMTSSESVYDPRDILGKFLFICDMFYYLYQDRGMAQDKEKTKEWFAPVLDYYISKWDSIKSWQQRHEIYDHIKASAGDTMDLVGLIEFFIDGSPEGVARAKFLTEILQNDDHLIYSFMLERQNNIVGAIHYLNGRLDIDDEVFIRQAKKLLGFFLTKQSPLDVEALQAVIKDLGENDPISKFLQYRLHKEENRVTEEELTELRELFEITQSETGRSEKLSPEDYITFNMFNQIHAEIYPRRGS